MSYNNTDKDIIPPLSLDYDCCAPEGLKSKLNAIHLDLPLKNIVNHLDDLRLARHKVEDADRLIAEQEWKMKRSKYDDHLSFLSYVGMVTTSLVMVMLHYCCCCKCCRRFPNFSKWWKDNNPCTTIVIKPKIINSVHSSKESLKILNTKASNKRKPSQGDAIEETELASLNVCSRHVTPSGKR
jgi:hypothetical protein